MIFSDTSFIAAVEDPAAAVVAAAAPAADVPAADVAPPAVPVLLLLLPHAVTDRATTTVAAPSRVILIMSVRSVSW
jgi:hypothetical protein